MNEDKYEVPSGTRYKVSIKKWNKVFGSRGVWPFVTSHVFVDHEKGVATIHFYYTIWAKIVMCILYPILVVESGHREAVDSIKDCWFQLTRRTFSSDYSTAGGKDWDKLMELIGQ